jgi:hypothetical protein
MKKKTPPPKRFKKKLLSQINILLMRDMQKLQMPFLMQDRKQMLMHLHQSKILFTSLNMIMLFKCGAMIGLLTVNSVIIKTIVNLLRATTGTVPNNADMPGNAEELELAKEADGAQDMMDVMEHHCPLWLQVLNPIIEWRLS